MQQLDKLPSIEGEIDRFLRADYSAWRCRAGLEQVRRVGDVNALFFGADGQSYRKVRHLSDLQSQRRVINRAEAGVEMGTLYVPGCS